MPKTSLPDSAGRIEDLLRLLAADLRAGADELVTRWLERLSQRVTLERDFLFPSEDLIDHVPVLVHALADYLEDESDEITADTPVVAKAMELGELRHEQGFAARQILWEYEILGGIVFNHLSERAVQRAGEGSSELMFRAGHRVFRALAVMQRATMDEFLAHADDRVREREERLRGFNRALSHEVKNEIGAILGAGRLLREEFIADSPAERRRFVDMVIQNAERVSRLVGNLLELSRIDGDSRQQRNVPLRAAVEEVVRQLRQYAETNGVELHVHDDVPAVEVNAAVVELALSNLIANGVKYHDPDRSDRRVEVQALDTGGEFVTVRVTDNGRGVAPEDRPHIFRRFYRAQQAQNSGVEGSGLGLALVRDAVERLGCRVWADFPPDGTTVFAFTLPSRRSTDSEDDADQAAAPPA